MTATHNLGNNYTIKETSGNDLTISHGSNGDVLKYDAGTDKISTLKTLTSLATEVLNNDEEPDIDMSLPTWFVRSASYGFDPNLESLDGWGETSSGSGSSTLEPEHVNLSTGGTDGSTEHLFRRPRPSGSELGLATWNKDFAMLVIANFADTQDELIIARGAYDSKDDTARHVGVGMEDGDFIGTAADGSTRSTVTLVSGASSGEKIVWIEFDAGTDVDFYVGDRSSVDGTVSSNLPSSTTQAGRTSYFAANAASGASDRQMDVVTSPWRQVP